MRLSRALGGLSRDLGGSMTSGLCIRDEQAHANESALNLRSPSEWRATPSSGLVQCEPTKQRSSSPEVGSIPS